MLLLFATSELNTALVEKDKLRYLSGPEIHDQDVHFT